MRKWILLAFVVGTTLAVAASPAAAASPTAATGRLTGVTQISFGCPGPVREGGPSCNPWRVFANARFSVSASGAEGTPIPGTSRLVVSDLSGKFSLRLAAGRYIVTPLRQRSTHGGPRRLVTILAGEVTNVVIRFQGFPQMV
jgi:hypothetical protein